MKAVVHLNASGVLTTPSTATPLSMHDQLRAALAGLESPALLSPTRGPVTGQDTFDLIESVAITLNRMGIRRGQRVAYALNDSAETGVLALAVMSIATAVPINPRLPVADFEKQLAALRVDVVIVPSGVESNARRAAQELKIRTIDVLPDDTDRSGAIRFIGQPAPDALVLQIEPEWAIEDDIAMVVQTSGTTGAQKIVPLAHRNLLSMMLANRGVLALTPADRCLGLMPLYHIHGLGAMLGSLLSGGSIVITGGFNVTDFFAQLKTFKPTWYTAVPTIHQTIIAHADQHRDLVADVARRQQLRLVRSGSAPMPRGTPAQLCRLFNTRYIEACGATEASAYICSNRFGEERHGSVGKPMPGTDVRVVDEHGNDVAVDVEGELIAKGPGIFAGYENNPALNEVAFRDGYFRTGDLAKRDAEGYYYITGRLKEQINRAGLKISPQEVDDVLSSHPGVQRAATFALPDPQVGEEIAAAVVKRTGQERLTALDLQRYAAEHLADYKVPRRIEFVDAIPTNSIGKITRVSLAKQLGLTATSKDESAHAWHEPITATQLAIAAIWSRVLGESVNNIDIDFHRAGGDSMQAMDLSLELERRFNRLVPVAAISSNATIRSLARAIDDDGWKPSAGAPVVFRAPSAQQENPPTLFCLPGVGGNVYCYAGIATRLNDPRVPIVGLPLPGTDGLESPLTDIHAIATRYIATMRQFQPRGPYTIIGYSFGGRVGFEVCRQLKAAGEQVHALILVDTPGPNWPPALPKLARWQLRVKRLFTEPLGTTWRRFTKLGRKKSTTPDAILDSLQLQNAPPERKRLQVALVDAVEKAASNWEPQTLDVPIIVLRARKPVWENCDTRDPAMGWSGLTSRAVRVIPIEGSHGSVFNAPDVETLARAINSVI